MNPGPRIDEPGRCQHQSWKKAAQKQVFASATHSRSVAAQKKRSNLVVHAWDGRMDAEVPKFGNRPLRR